MPSVNILINTFNRETILKSLITNLKSNNHNIHITIVNDGSKYELPINESMTYIQLGRNHGKKEYWKVCNKLFSIREDADYYIMIPDDAIIDHRFVDKAIHLWRCIDDPDKVCLNLLVDKTRKAKKCWTGYEPKRRSWGGNLYWKTQWVDMCFIAERKFFNIIYPIKPINLSDEQLKTRGSGVGGQISKALHQKGSALYQLDKTLVQHGKYESVMHPELRKLNPLKT